jgi:hypothetical protein
MTLEQYRTLSKEEQDMIMSTLEKMEYPVPPGLVPISLWDIETYYKKRHREREKNTTISWPTNLSRKEQVICKIDMIRTMLEYSLIEINNINQKYNIIDIPQKNADDFTFINAMILFCKSVERDIYKHKSTIDGPKWVGIASDAASLLNLLFKPMMKSFQKKNQI